MSDHSDWKGTTGQGAVFRSLNLNPDFNPNYEKIIKRVRKEMTANEPYANREDRAAAYSTYYERFKRDYK